MNIFFDQCCSKLNFFICGSNSSKRKINKIKSNKEKSRRVKSSQCSTKNFTENIFYNQSELTNLTEKRSKYLNFIGFSSNSTRFSSEMNKRNLFDSSINFTSCSSIEQIQIKRIIFSRRSFDEKLGLTLCYGLNKDLTTTVFIQDIEEESLAKKEGSIRIGDQIIKINNEIISSRDQVIILVSNSLNLQFEIQRFQIKSKSIDKCFEEKEIPIEQIRRSFSCSRLKIERSSSCPSLRKEKFEFDEEINQFNSLINLLNPFDNSWLNRFHQRIIRKKGEILVKPLPRTKFNFNRTKIEKEKENQMKMKSNRRRSREKRRFRDHRIRSNLTTDDEHFSELKQGKYWTRQQRKEQFIKSKENRQREIFFRNQSRFYSNFRREDFNLLNRIFIRENHQELRLKPHLAWKYRQQSNQQKSLLKNNFHIDYFHRIKGSCSRSNSTCLYSTSTIIL